MFFPTDRLRIPTKTQLHLRILQLGHSRLNFIQPVHDSFLKLIEHSLDLHEINSSAKALTLIWNRIKIVACGRFLCRQCVLIVESGIEGLF